MVLVPRGGTWGATVAADAIGVGLTPWIMPLIETVPMPSAALTAALGRLAAGDYHWLVLTSAAAVPALAGMPTGRTGQDPRGWKVAAVGERTAAALRAAGIAVDLVGAGGASELVHVWPSQPGQRVLAVQSDRAKPTLAQGLRKRGCSVEVVSAYRTIATTLTDAEQHAVRSGTADVALLTSGTVARRLAQIPVSATTRLVAIGPQTAQDAHAAGIPPTIVASAPTVASLLHAAQEVT